MPVPASYLQQKSQYSAMRAKTIALALSALSFACVLSMAAPARAERQPVGQGLEDSFRSAAGHWGVPVELLMGIGYVESHWEWPTGEDSEDPGYGIMHLVGGTGGTLERGAKLSGLSIDSVKLYPAANIEASAAILSYISLQLHLTKSSKLIDWYGVVEEYIGVQDARIKDGYARDVFTLIEQGKTATLTSGEQLTLSPVGRMDLPPAPPPGPMSDDYGPALWVPANANNYTSGRPYGPLGYIIIHDTEGSYASAISWFQNPNSGVSAHYVIRSSDGQITQMVRESNTAYQAGVWDYNVRALGIEHEGYMSQPGWYTNQMYAASADLARNMADRYGISKDRAHIIGHYQVPNQSHVDPGPLWNWTYYMSLVRRDTARAGLVDNTDSAFVPIPSQIDPAHYWSTYQGGYNSTNAYATGSVTDQQYSVNSGTWTAQLPDSGYYDVYAFIPWVDNNTPDTANARYKVYASDGLQIAHISQKAITDVGSGSWVHVGKFLFSAGAGAAVSLDDYTGETGRNVWFDSIMWIPSTGSAPPPTNTPVIAPTNTRTRTPTNTPTRRPTSTPTFTSTRTYTPRPTWTPGPCGMRFSDLPDTHWAYSYVAYLYCRQVIAGYADGTFRPGNSITRGQLAKMLALGYGWNLYNPVYPDFSDVPPDSVFYTYVETAFLRGVVAGYSDGTYRPGNSVTRAQVTKMLVLAQGWDQFYPSFPDFSDVQPDFWAYGYIEAAYSHGIISGYSDGTFHPGEQVTRAQFSKMLTLLLSALVVHR